MNQEKKPATTTKTGVEYLQLIEQHLNTIKQIIIFLVIMNTLAAIIQICSAVATAAGVQLY